MVEMTELYIRRLAIVMGLALPLGEVVRRWGTTESFTFWITHLVVGVPLLYGAWSHARDRAKGLRCLAAAWAFSCGVLYTSFFYWWRYPPGPDPGDTLSKPVPLWLLSNAFVGGGLGICVVGLIGTLRALEPRDRQVVNRGSTRGIETERAAEQ